ncbi:MAG: CxxxxCH/CxxCH domain c-type cytochrome, partial [Anaeromyxobacteraceae bacterium]
ADANAKAAPPIGTRGETATSTKAVGAHAAHLNQTTFRPAPVSCGECHVVPAAGDKTHGNNALSMPFGTLARTGGAAATYNATTLSCATVYCHGGAGGTVSVQAGAASTPSWTGTFTPGASSLNCGSCHPALPTANAHPQRPDCGTCHAGATATAYNSASHLNGVIDVLPLGCAMCHGNASVVAVTGADLNIQASPPLDTKGNGGTTAVGVGVHQAHVNTTRAKPVACAACHAGAVPTVMQHANGVVTVAFAGVSTTGGVVPSYQPAGGSCAATYCHGNFTGGAGSIATPAWISAGTLGCASCHGNPPTANGHPQDAACADCHGAGYSTTTVNAATHVDGLVTLPTAAHPAGTCTACHGDATKTVIAAAEPNAKAAPPISSKGETTTAQRGVGAHAAHLDQTTFRGTAVACAECHPAVPAGDRTHANGTAAIAFGAAATYRGAAPAWNAASLSCASVYCHGNFTLGNGNGAGGGTATAPTAAPTGVAFSGVAANSLGLSWAAVTGATSYKVERAPNNAGAAGTFVQIGTAAGTSYADAGLTASTTYWYRVRATNDGGDGPYSANASQATAAASTGTGTGTATRYDLAPATATSVGTDGSTTVTAQTTYDYNNPAQTFRALGVAGYTQSSTQGRLRASTALSANTTYTVVNLYTPALTATNGTVAANMPVSIDSYVRTGASNSTATIRAVLYEYNGTTGNVGSAKGTYTSPSINTSSTTSTFTTLTGTIPNAAFTVAAGNRLKVVLQVVTGSTGGNDVAILFGAARSGTNGQTFITPTLGGSTGTTPTAPGAAPTTLAFTNVAQTTLSLGWSAVTGATHYKVERAPNLSGAPGTFAQVGTTATASFGDAGLAANTTYWYRVRAWNAGGDGPYSANASQTTSAVAPPAGGISWTGAFTPGTSSLNCQSCHGMPPAGTHPTLTAGTNCGGCHVGYNAVAGATTGAVHPTNHLNAAVDPMPPGTEPTAATTSCGGCHGTILNAMNGTTAKASKHTLGTDASADAAVSWTGTNLAAV